MKPNRSSNTTFLPFLLAACLFMVTSCSDNQTATAANKTAEAPTPAPSPVASTASMPVKPLVINKEEGWGADITLSITRIRESDSARFFTVISSYGDRNLGIEITVPKSKKSGSTFNGGLVFKSIGAESDYFLQTLSQLYNQKIVNGRKFTNAVSLTSVNLRELISKGNDERGSVVAAEYKLFFEGNDEKEYAELYLNISPDGTTIELKEKDEEYRAAIIKFLTQK